MRHSRRRLAWVALVGSASIMAAASVYLIAKPQQSAGPQHHGTGPRFLSASANREQVGVYEKFELTLRLEADYENPYDPEQIDLRAEFVSPAGKQWRINGFYDGSNWRVRFAPNESGQWRYRTLLTDKTGTAAGEQRTFQAVPSGRHGWVRVSDRNKRFLQHDDGTTFYGIGVAYPWNVNESGLDQIKASGGNFITYWNGNYDNAGNGGGKEQLESAASGIGRYDMAKGFRIDELVEQFEARGMHMNFAVWPHDSLADRLKGWPAAWNKNAYSALGPASDFYKSKEMWRYQEKLYRYIIARWGYSEAIGTWDLIVEISGTDGWEFGGRKSANAWTEKVHRYFRDNDPFRHPTTGSRAGNEDDYWTEGYETLDIADRENYYDLSPAAYAADIAKRWKSFEKPLVIGETGNITDPAVYHRALWSSLASGLASAPVWWDFTKVDADMYERMKRFSVFVGTIDFHEERTPAELMTKTVTKMLDRELQLENFADVSGWAQPDWADANKDESGAPYIPAPADDSLVTRMLFRTGKYAQGAVQQSFPSVDWSPYDVLTVDVYVEQDGDERIKARPVLFPNGKWTEGDDPSDAELVSGQWVTLRVPLREAGKGYWRDESVGEEELRSITGWGVKLYTGKSSETAKPVTVKLRNGKLLTERTPTVTMKESQGWVMTGSRISYGWLYTESGGISGKTAELKGLGKGKFAVSWYDSWQGIFLPETTVESADGEPLRLTAPNVPHADAAFTIRRLT